MVATPGPHCPLRQYRSATTPAPRGGSGDTLLGTFDGGLHWSLLITSGGSFFGWSGPIFPTASTGFVVGPTHYAPEHLYRTSDGGRSWNIDRF